MKKLVNPRDFELEAQKYLSSASYQYAKRGSLDKLTQKWNEEDFQQIRFKPRGLANTSELKGFSKSLFGH